MLNSEITRKSLLIVGCGKIGLNLGTHLSKDFDVYGVRRQPFNATGIKSITADVTLPETLEKLPKTVDYLVYCLTPGERSEQGYQRAYVDGLRNVLNVIDSNALKRLFFISSTSVYHQDDSAWVDEHSPTMPDRFSGRILLEAENLSQQCGAPSTSIRFSGIYGGQRSRLIDQVKEGRTKLSKNSHLTNRIHEADCVGILAHLIRLDAEGVKVAPLYLASDDEPVEYNEVIRFIADKLSESTNKKLFLTEEDTPKQSRAAGNKKCSNQALKESGYTFKYPSYREGYETMLGSVDKH